MLEGCGLEIQAVQNFGLAPVGMSPTGHSSERTASSFLFMSTFRSRVICSYEAVPLSHALVQVPSIANRPAGHTRTPYPRAVPRGKAFYLLLLRLPVHACVAFSQTRVAWDMASSST